MAVYSFDTEDAKRYGQEEAVILFNIRHWVAKNKANGKHFYEGRWWTYNSVEAFAELFDFWSPKQIRRIVESLEKQGAILTGNFNQNPYDRTKWFTVANWPICPNGQMELPEWANGDDQTGKSITDNKPDSKPDIDAEYKLAIGWLNSKTGKEYKGDKNSRKSFNARRTEGWTLTQIYGAIEAASKDDYHKKTSYRYLTMEYITREQQLDRWVNVAGVAATVPEGERKLIGHHVYVPFGQMREIRQPVYEGDKKPSFGFVPLKD